MELTKKQSEYSLTQYKPTNIVEAQELALLEKRHKVSDFLGLEVRSFDDLVRIDCADIETITRTMGVDQSCAILMAVMAKQFNSIKNDFDVNGIKDLAYEIVLEYPKLKPTDVILMNRMALMGKLGELYSGIRIDRYFGMENDRNKGFIYNYLDRKAAYIERRIREKKVSLSTEEKKSIPMPDKYKSSYLQSQKKEVTKIFQSIKEWSDYYGRDWESTSTEIEEKIKSEYEDRAIRAMDYDNFKAFRERQILFNINGRVHKKKKIDVRDRDRLQKAAQYVDNRISWLESQENGN